MINSHFWGRIPYNEAYRMQRDLWCRRVAGEIPDQLLLLEHPPVITLGRGARAEHLLFTPERLSSLGVELHETDRGGDVTYHGPGQLVGYPILDLKPDRMDVLRYLRDLEEVLIRTIRHFGLEGTRQSGFTGVWVEGRKIAAIGVKISRWVTYHGFALNVSTDLSHFGLIVPCGIHHAGVTSITMETGLSPSLVDVSVFVIEELESVFGQSPPLAHSVCSVNTTSTPESSGDFSAIS